MTVASSIQKMQIAVSLPAVAVDLEDAAVDDNSSDAVAVMLLSLLSSFLFLLPVFFVHSKKARRHAKPRERFRGTEKERT